MAVYDGVFADIQALPAALRSTGLSAQALVLAERLDEAGARDSAAIARELRATLAELRDLSKAAPREVDPLDDLGKRRAARLANPAPPDGAAGGDVGRT